MYNCIICNNTTYPLVYTLDTTNVYIQYRYCSYCFHVKNYKLENNLDLSPQTWPKIENYLNNIITNFVDRDYKDISPKDYILLDDIDKLNQLKNNYIYKFINLDYLLCKLENPSFILQKIKKHSDHNTIILALSPRFKLNLFNINSDYSSFFNASSFQYLLEKHNFFIGDVKRDVYNYAFKFSISGNQNTNVMDIKLNELYDDIYTSDTYEMYKIKSNIYKNTMDNLMLYNIWSRLNTYNNL